MIKEKNKILEDSFWSPICIYSLMMSEHVEKDRLVHDIQYRFEYVSKFLNFTPADVALLNAFAPILLPRVPVIADTVYRKLFAFDITKCYFIIHNHEFDKIPINNEANLTLDSAQMTYRKDMLSTYLKRVFTQTEWNECFLQFLSNVGRLHTSQAGVKSINVDYIHINCLFGYLEQLLIDMVMNSENLDDLDKSNTVFAINKLFWIQNDFFTIHLTAKSNENSVTIEAKLPEPSCCCLLN